MKHELLIGPANYAGQASAMAEAVTRTTAVRAFSASLTKSKAAISFPADITIPRLRWALDPVWRRQWRGEVKSRFGSVLIDGGLPLLRGGLTRTSSGRVSLSRAGLAADIYELREAGVDVGLMFHGSEIRSPLAHRRREPRSPFHTMDERSVAELTETVEHTSDVARQTGCALFVTTPDLLIDCPSAMWLPTVVAAQRWSGGRPIELDGRPVVLAAPSSDAIAGARDIDGSLRDLHDRGRVTYIRAENMPPAAMPDLIRSADVVIDKVGLGLYGVIALEAMAAGRLVLGYASTQVRDELRRHGSEVPVVDLDPADVGGCFEAIGDDSQRFLQVAAEGPGFVEQWHSGVVTAQRITTSLSVTP